MRTPRPSTTPRRGVSTLIGYGWLREAPKNFWPRSWDLRGRSALKKCMFMPMSPEAQAYIASLPPPVLANPTSSAHPPPANRPPTPAFRRHDPMKNARMFPAVSPDLVHAKRHDL